MVLPLVLLLPSTTTVGSMRPCARELRFIRPLVDIHHAGDDYWNVPVSTAGIRSQLVDLS